MTYCKVCLNKQQKINELEDEIVSLKTKLRYQQRSAKEGFFGSSTPSAKIPLKPNRHKEHQRNRGGGKVGHQGHGRASICQEDANKVEKIRIADTCPIISSANVAPNAKSSSVSGQTSSHSENTGHLS